MQSCFRGVLRPDQSSSVEVFDVLASSALLTSASKMVDVWGCQNDWAIQQLSALQADTKSKLKGTETSISLPRD